LELTTDGHEASHSLSETAELLVLNVMNGHRLQRTPSNPLASVTY